MYYILIFIKTPHDFVCCSAEPVLFTHCQKRDFEAKKCSVLLKILIGFSENPLELGKIGGDSWTQIFTAFSMQKRCGKPWKHGIFGALAFAIIFRQILSSSVLATWLEMHLPFPGTWVRIPHHPPKSSRADLLRPLTPPCMQFGTRRFNSKLNMYLLVVIEHTD